MTKRSKYAISCDEFWRMNSLRQRAEELILEDALYMVPVSCDRLSLEAEVCTEVVWNEEHRINLA